MTSRFIVIGNPENRRVLLFTEALRAQGQREPEVVSWLELVRDPHRLERLSPDPALVRIDSAGESFEVDRELLKLGYHAAVRAEVTTVNPAQIDELTYDRGLILCPRQQHLGFLAVLARLEEIFARRPAWRVLNPPRSIATLFDKRETSRLYQSLGIPVPPRLEPVATLADLRARLDERGCATAFVKVSCSSSASCLAIFHRRPGGDFLITTIEQARTGWYNSLKLRRIEHSQRVEEIVAFLLREGSQVEEEVPKARLDGAFFDCRVLVVAGAPAFLVVRQNRHPITNLHLLGWRGDRQAFERLVPPQVRAVALESCTRAFAAHGCLHVGVDVLFEENLAGHRVIEANAFGDLLPNLSRDGLSVYEWEIRAALGMLTAVG